MISCDCSVDIDYWEGWGREVKARKAHVCCECGGEIAIGDIYQLVELVSDGLWSRYKTCTSCAQIRQTYCPNGAVMGYLAGHIRNCLGWEYLTNEVDCPDWQCSGVIPPESDVCPCCGLDLEEWHRKEQG